MQKVGETAKGCLVGGIKDYLAGRSVLREQKDVPGDYAGYEEFYPESYLNWTADSHDKLLRRFQTFRGQHHRVDLKARWDGQEWEVVTMELHRCKARGTAGDVLGVHAGLTLVRTTEGVALVGAKPFVKDEGLPGHLDRREQAIVAPGYRKNTYRVSQFRSTIR